MQLLEAQMLLYYLVSWNSEVEPTGVSDTRGLHIVTMYMLNDISYIS
jgi:hypothetical protein